MRATSKRKEVCKIGPHLPLRAPFLVLTFLPVKLGEIKASKELSTAVSAAFDKQEEQEDQEDQEARFLRVQYCR